MVKFWSDNCDDGSYQIDKCVAGNDVTLSLDQIPQSFDVLIVATSSFGEGDPPANFLDFFLMLKRGLSSSAAHGTTPLKGLQHAVIGYGQSVYPTFQNCPRLTDKYLGKWAHAYQQLSARTVASVVAAACRRW